jgi:hypothetical protein
MMLLSMIPSMGYTSRLWCQLAAIASSMYKRGPIVLPLANLVMDTMVLAASGRGRASRGKEISAIFGVREGRADGAEVDGVGPAD